MKQSKTIQAQFQLPDARLGIIVSRFNHIIVDGLLQGALEVLKAHGVRQQNIHILEVPGAFEMPLLAKRMAVSTRYDALIALGAVIRGDTAHFEYVAGACTTGLAEVILRYDIPIGFGVLTVDNLAQATERAGANDDNKGKEAALAMLQMIKLLRGFDAQTTPAQTPAKHDLP